MNTNYTVNHYGNDSLSNSSSVISTSRLSDYNVSLYLSWSGSRGHSPLITAALNNPPTPESPNANFTVVRVPRHLIPSYYCSRLRVEAVITSEIRVTTINSTTHFNLSSPSAGVVEVVNDTTTSESKSMYYQEIQKTLDMSSAFVCGVGDVMFISKFSLLPSNGQFIYSSEGKYLLLLYQSVILFYKLMLLCLLC